jgi:hypothetical protein
MCEGAGGIRLRTPALTHPLVIDRVGYTEGIPDQRDPRAIIHYHLDDIESVHDLRPVKHTQPLLRSSEQTLLLGRCHGRVRRTERVGTAGFYFDENQCIRGPITAN